MLVLTRQIDEAVRIGDEIEVTIVDIRNGKVRLGIEAPKSVGVHRREVWLALKKDSTTGIAVKQPASISTYKNYHIVSWFSCGFWVSRIIGFAPGVLIEGRTRDAALQAAKHYIDTNDA